MKRAKWNHFIFKKELYNILVAFPYDIYDSSCQLVFQLHRLFVVIIIQQRKTMYFLEQVNTASS